jgi:hypothetical protein
MCFTANFNNKARLGMRYQVQLHMKAIQQLLHLCRDKNIYLNGSIKRAIFWYVAATIFCRPFANSIPNRQDLNCSVIAGSRRLFDHITFVELEWKRDPFTPNFYTLSSGFQARAQLFSDEFITVLEDMHALQRIRDSPNFGCRDTGEMMRYDSHQGSVQSRLVDLPKLSLFMECCYLAVYISACQLCSKAWRALAIPVSELHLLYLVPILLCIQTLCQISVLTRCNRPICRNCYYKNYNKRRVMAFGTTTPIYSSGFYIQEVLISLLVQRAQAILLL